MQANENFPFLTQWLADELPQVFQDRLAEVGANAPAFLNHNQYGAYAAAQVAIEIGREWQQLADPAKQRAAGEFYDDVDYKRYTCPGNWNEPLMALGRTRSLMSDADCIVAGRPEDGLYYWY